MPDKYAAAPAAVRKPRQTKRREIRRDELPLHCPPPGASLWNAHPRVYLPLEETGKAQCPYCGAEFVLKED